MIDGKGLSERAAKLYHVLDDLNTWDKRDVVAILNTIVQLEIDRQQRSAQKSEKR